MLKRRHKTTASLIRGQAMKKITVGQGRQFPTIQAAVDSLPSFLSEDTYVEIHPGEYKEDVKVSNITGRLLFIEGIKQHIDSTSVMNIRCYDIRCLLRINNLRFVWSDQINKATTKSVVLFSRCTYASADYLKFLGKTKSSNLPTIQYDGSIGAVHNCYFHNQKTCIFSKSCSQVRVDNNNTHSTTPSTYFLFAQFASIYYAAPIALPAQTKNKTYKAGQIFT